MPEICTHTLRIDPPCFESIEKCFTYFHKKRPFSYWQVKGVPFSCELETHPHNFIKFSNRAGIIKCARIIVFSRPEGDPRKDTRLRLSHYHRPVPSICNKPYDYLEHSNLVSTTTEIRPLSLTFENPLPHPNSIDK